MRAGPVTDGPNFIELEKKSPIGGPMMGPLSNSSTVAARQFSFIRAVWSEGKSQDTARRVKLGFLEAQRLIRGTMIYDVNSPLLRSFLSQKGGSSDRRSFLFLAVLSFVFSLPNPWFVWFPSYQQSGWTFSWMLASLRASLFLIRAPWLLNVGVWSCALWLLFVGYSKALAVLEWAELFVLSNF